MHCFAFQIFINLHPEIEILSKKVRDDGKDRIGVGLTVAEANRGDVGRRIARIDPKVAEDLGLSSGDILLTYNFHG